MKKIIPICLILLSHFAFGQTVAFKSLRFDEDYSLYAKDTTKNAYRALKFTPLSKDGAQFISFGGELRSQYFKYQNPDWGDGTKDPDGFVLSRYLLHADLHLGKYFRTFAQLQSSLSSGEADQASPVNENPLELHQVFADGLLPLRAGSSIALRVGRQELSYGSQRLVSVRDAPNNRQSFDGVKILLRTKKIKTDLFYSHYVQAKTGIFDDRYSSGTKFWGAYFSTAKIPLLDQLDVYYLGFERAESKFDDVKGKEKRHSVGVRISGIKSMFEYDIESLYQFGDVAALNISAWTLSAHLSLKLSEHGLQPKVGIKSEMISGDKQYGDGRLNSFNPLFPRGGYFGLAALIGPSNLFDVHPYIEILLAKNLVLTQDYDIFRRMETTDGIYAVNGRLLYSGKTSDSKDIGTQLGTALEYNPSRFLYLRGEFTWFNTGNYLKQVSGGKDILMYGLTATFKF
ncbi:alginate export family protein [Pedobacter sp. GSP4]|uniref:alginate export family protein n=1 Tax=Pedobacter sp. GSP4 TaxID=3453716 RepID=UPI003EEAD849